MLLLAMVLLSMHMYRDIEIRADFLIFSCMNKVGLHLEWNSEQHRCRSGGGGA